jgi:hypothetical protein
MPQLTLVARAVRLAVRVKATELMAEATSVALHASPLVMHKVASVELHSRAHFTSLITRANPVTLMGVVYKSITLTMSAHTDFTPLERPQSLLVGAAMVGDFSLG